MTPSPSRIQTRGEEIANAISHGCVITSYSIHYTKLYEAGFAGILATPGGHFCAVFLYYEYAI